MLVKQYGTRVGPVLIFQIGSTGPEAFLVVRGLRLLLGQFASHAHCSVAWVKMNAAIGLVSPDWSLAFAREVVRLAHNVFDLLWILDDQCSLPHLGVGLGQQLLLEVFDLLDLDWRTFEVARYSRHHTFRFAGGRHHSS